MAEADLRWQAGLEPMYQLGTLAKRLREFVVSPWDACGCAGVRPGPLLLSWHLTDSYETSLYRSTTISADFMQKTRATGLRLEMVEKNRWMKGGLWSSSCGRSTLSPGAAGSLCPSRPSINAGWWGGSGGGMRCHTSSMGHRNKTREKHRLQAID